MNIISELIGILYVILWSTGFYFQLLINYKLKSGDGYSLDFQILNIYAYICLFINYIYNYYDNNWGVKFNDVFFSWHSAIISIIILIQTFYYPLKNNKINIQTILNISILTTGLILYYIINCYYDDKFISTIKLFGFNKIIITIFKYYSQIAINYKKKSTKGWSTINSLTDFLGSLLSILQIIIDYNCLNSEYKELDQLFNVKMLLGWVSFIMETIIISQIITFYKNNKYMQLI